jgi:phospholipid-transporting ATPase
VIYLPLSVIVAVSALKDIIEDYKRKKSDYAENNRAVKRVINGRIETTRWRNIQIGDIVKVLALI